MVAQALARSPAISGRRSAFQSGFAALRATLLLAAFLLAGCASAPPAPLAWSDPADSAAPAPRATYQTVVGPYASRRPRDPSAWREQNERIAPEAKP